jgi:hypothetical protein
MDQQQTVLADDELWGVPAPAPTAPDGEAGTPGGGGRRRWIAAVVGTAAIGVAAVVGANLASSGTSNLAAGGGAGGAGGAGGFGGPGGRGNVGTIASIDGSTIKMSTQDASTVSVVTSSSTTVTLSSTGALADVNVGDNVRITGTTSDSTVAATSITDSGSTALGDGPGAPGFGGPPPGAAPSNATTGATPPAGGNRPTGGPGTTGVVKSVNGSSFTVTTSAGATVTATTSSSTAVTVVKPGTLAALKVGDTIQVNGTAATDGTLTATSIRSGAVLAGR